LLSQLLCVGLDTPLPTQRREPRKGLFPFIFLKTKPINNTVKKIQLANNFIYEFDIDLSIVDQALISFLSITNVRTQPSMRDGKLTTVGIFGVDQEDRSYIPISDPKLNQEIQKCLDEVSKIHFIDIKLKICDSWITKTTFGSSSAIHFHPYSIFSGLVYLTSHKRSETVFVLDDPIYTKYSNLLTYSVKNLENAYNINPTKGKLLIWESGLKHKINPHTDKEERYTFAFNTWFTGDISTYDTNRLKLDVIDVERQKGKV